MSGGVDSTVSASILKDLGYNVTGVFFIMHSSHLSMVADAQKAASDCGIQLEIRDLREAFKENVTDAFANEYLSGKTPNPCVMCNKTIKFPYLARTADELGIDLIATGHYAGISEQAGLKFICRGKDILKDQSYFLYPLGQDILSRLILPLSGLSKPEVREYAEAHGFAAAKKHDSQDICFIPDGDSGEFVRTYSGAVVCPGEFLKTDGKVLGTHKGIFNYTVGQRRGLGIAADAPLYVTKIDTDTNSVILGYENELYKDTITLKNCVFADTGKADSPFEADVCIRYSKKCSKAVISPDGDGTYRVVFTDPQRGPAPGQSAVFYEDDRVLGGGIIC